MIFSGDTRKEAPTAWTELLAHNTATLGDTADVSAVTDTMATDIITGARTLANEELDENRFFGLGLLACEFAQLIADPEIRDRAVVSAATDMVKIAEVPRHSTGLRIADVRASKRLPTFARLVDTAYDIMPLAMQLTADSLGVVANERRLERLGMIVNYETGPKFRFEYMPPYSPVDSLLQDRKTARNVADEAVSGALTVTKLGLSAFWKAKNPQSNHVVANPYIAQVRDAGFRFSSHFKTVATKAAILRLDEFNNDLRKFVVSDDAGELQFNTPLLRDDLAPPVHTDDEPSSLLHTKRLRCPAIQVPGLIGMISLDIIPDILTEADRQMAERAKPKYS